MSDSGQCSIWIILKIIKFVLVARDLWTVLLDQYNLWGQGLARTWTKDFFKILELLWTLEEITESSPYDPDIPVYEFI